MFGLGKNSCTVGVRRSAFILRAIGVRIGISICAILLLSAQGIPAAETNVEPVEVEPALEFDASAVAGAPIPPGKYLLVGSTRCNGAQANCQTINAVHRYNANPGPNFGRFEGVHVSNIMDPQGMIIHPTRGTLLVVSRTTNQVKEYNLNTGAFIRNFITAGIEGLFKPQSIVVLPNGNIGVTSIQSAGNFDKLNGIAEYDDQTGEFVRYFVDGGFILEPTCEPTPGFPNAPCLQAPAGMIRGNNNNIYVASAIGNDVVEYNGQTGVYVGHFTSGKLVGPEGLVQRPVGTTNAGNILVTSVQEASPSDSHKVLEFNGTTRLLVSTGGGVLVGGLENPGSLIFESNTVLLISDRLHWRVFNVTNPGCSYSDRIRRNSAVNGLACTTAACEPDVPTPQPAAYFTWSVDFSPSNQVDCPLHWASGFLMTDLGCDADSECFDNNPCTDDVCDLNTHICDNPPNNAPDPDDGIFCNGVEDRCENGHIVYLTPAPNCNDNLTCTTDRCDEGPMSHVCAHVLQADQCLIAGVCHDSRDPNPANPCQECDPQTPNSWTTSTVGTPCGDQQNNDCNRPNTCNASAVCLNNYESNGSPCGSNASNACTDPDTCNGSGLCLPNHRANNIACSDGMHCTLTDRCNNGVCVGTGTPCTNSAFPFCIETATTFVCGQCVADTDCVDNPARCTSVRCLPDVYTCFEFPNDANCLDPLFCDGVDHCNGATGQCDPGTPPCGQNKVCDEANNICLDCGGNQDCDNGLFCDGVELCQSGNCVAGTPVNCSGLTTNCLVGVCDEVDNRCETIPGNEGGICDDGNQCTPTDRCNNGVCVGSGSPPQCDDGNICTTDSCDPVLGCRFVNNNAACNDNNPCTSNDTCSGGICTGGAATPCDDGNACTTDTCNPVTGCRFTPRTGSCDDGNICTLNDICFAGLCVGGQARNCSDGNPCTEDLCEPGIGCRNPNHSEGCEDGNACTVGDVCSNGSCVPGTPMVCNDNNPCTNDTCSGGNCQFVNNTSPCNDGLLCTLNDTCNGGTCAGTPRTCSPGFFCHPDDGACRQCSGPAECNDGNVCTNDACVSGVCQHTNNTVSCNDGLNCTTGDHCSNGSCSGTPVTCPQGRRCDPLDGVCKQCLSDGECGDNNFCTTDRCQTGTCQNTAHTNPCDDENPCTLNDVCSATTARCGGTPVTCPPGSFCDPDDGECKQCNDDGDCDDHDACTADRCVNDVCLHDRPPGQCNDNSACTLDSCNPQSGLCTNSPRGCVYGDLVGGNCEVDLDDILCVLNGFARRNACPRADVFPCTPNNEINFDDVSAVMKAFEGDPPCPDPSNCP